MLFRLIDIIPFIVNHFVLALTNKKEKRKLISDQFFYGAILGLLGARLVYVALHLSSFSGNVFSIINPAPYNFNLIGGIVVSIFVILFISRKKDVSLEENLSNYAFGFYSLFSMIALSAYLKGIFYPLSLMSGSDMKLLIACIVYVIAAFVEKLIIKDKKGTIALFIVLLVLRMLVL
ncbi:hypothetical protein EZV73_19005 [Acidaminobacter sp. JC074]|uniref:prolipoprotein diacylglyceryl transferase family protein n=1 Tax=Acidaminobacter sp. JC074 TaxID=2530199 RepID=UPI001F0FB6AF|nr:prolipoprotein diacylglyceryl transferase family protein [Acidaminobacter sp. JC074]MCH4889679.1 hypothetical protein [Acidaminobacter sp. JC074]